MNTIYNPIDKETAHRAHSGTSFSPERRGEQEIQGHKEIFEDLQKDLGDFFTQDHADKLHSLYTDYLHSHANVMSTMITGPARFPTARNCKRSEWADNKRNAISEYCRNLKKWKEKADKREAVAAAGGELAVKKAELKNSLQFHEDMKQLNKSIKSSLKKGEITRDDIDSFKVLFPSLGNDAVERACRNDDWYGYGFPSFSLTNSNARIKGMRARVAELEKREAAKESGVEAEEVDIPGGIVSFDRASNRINIKHDEKPSREIIQIIKSNGFRWSRNYGTWTRQWTDNAMYSIKRIVPELRALATSEV